jgi:hypothetical protein
MAASLVDWVAITSGTNGDGNGTVAYSVQANTSSPQRVGTIAIGDRTFCVTQTGTTSPTFTAKVNGNSFDGSINAWVELGSTTFIVYADDIYSNEIRLSVPKPPHSGTYTLASGFGNSDYVPGNGFAVYNDDANNVGYATTAKYTGTLTFSNYDATTQTVSGTFSFTAWDYYSDKTVIVTDGVFANVHPSP